MRPATGGGADSGPGADPAEDAPEPVRIPHDELEPATLRAVVESFVLREGTDYGEHEVSLSDKVDAVIRELAAGDAVLYFEPRTETVHIVARRDAG